MEVILVIKKSDGTTIWQGNFNHCPYKNYEYSVYSSFFPDEETVIYEAQISATNEIEMI